MPSAASPSRPPPAPAPVLAPELVLSVQPTRDTMVWQQNRLAEARYKLNLREQKLLLYVISMLEPEAQDFGRCKVSVQGYAELTGLEPDDLYQELRDTALSIREKTLVVEGVLEPGMLRPVRRHGSWFEYVDEATGDGFVTIKLSAWLRPFLLQVRREFFRYQLNYALGLRSEYSIRLYQWLKRWQFAGRRTESVAQLRLHLGATEVDHEGRVVRENLAAYKHFKRKALTPALAEINARTDLSVASREEKVKGSKAVASLTFTIRASQASPPRLAPVRLPERPQLELPLEPSAELAVPPADPPLSLFVPAGADEGAREVGAWMEEFGLSPRQRGLIEEQVRARGLGYVREKAEVVRSAPRDNAARAFLAALRQDWQAPRRLRAPAAGGKPSPTPARQRQQREQERAQADEAARLEARRQQVEAHLAGLDPAARASLEAAAILASGIKGRVAAPMRRMIVRGHVMGLLPESPVPPEAPGGADAAQPPG